MSNRNREGELFGGATETYPTPAWATRSLVASGVLPRKGHFVDAGAGMAEIPKAIEAAGHDKGIVWDLVELRKLPEAKASDPYLSSRHEEDFLAWTVEKLDPRIVPVMRFPYDVAISNPPFSKALEFVGAMLELAPLVVVLLPLPWYGGEERREFFEAHPPASLLVVPHRIQFVDPSKPAVCPRCEGSGEVTTRTKRTRANLKETLVPRGHCNACDRCHDELGTDEEPGPCRDGEQEPGRPAESKCKCGARYTTKIETCDRCDGARLVKASSPSIDHAWWVWNAYHQGPTVLRRLAPTPQSERSWGTK